MICILGLCTYQVVHEVYEIRLLTFHHGFPNSLAIMHEVPGISVRSPVSTLFAVKGALPVPSTSQRRILQFITWA